MNLPPGNYPRPPLAPGSPRPLTPGPSDPRPSHGQVIVFFVFCSQKASRRRTVFQIVTLSPCDQPPAMTLPPGPYPRPPWPPGPLTPRPSAPGPPGPLGITLPLGVCGVPRASGPPGNISAYASVIGYVSLGSPSPNPWGPGAYPRGTKVSN